MGWCLVVDFVHVDLLFNDSHIRIYIFAGDPRWWSMVSQTQIGLSTVAASKFSTLLLPPGRRPKPLALRLAISFLSSLLPWRHADAGPAEVGLTDYDIDYRVDS